MQDLKIAIQTIIYLALILTCQGFFSVDGSLCGTYNSFGGSRMGFEITPELEKVVTKCAHKFYRKGVTGLDLDDLISEGYIGAMTAHERYDPNNAKGASFPTYAYYWISHQIRTFVRKNTGLINRYATRKGQKAFTNNELIRDKSLDAPKPTDNRSSGPDSSLQIAGTYPNPEVLAIEMEESQQFRAYIATRGKRVAAIFAQVFEGKSYAEIAKPMRVTRQSIGLTVVHEMARAKRHFASA